MSSASDFKPLTDYNTYKKLADDPVKMAMYILELQAEFKHFKIRVDPSRRQAILLKLMDCAERSQTDPEAAHSDADDVLLEWIDDDEIAKAFGSVKKWYA